jgi:hypothetical protein
MTSYGEGEVYSQSRTIGRIRVQAIFVGSEIYPRLGLLCSAALIDIVDDTTKGLANYELRDITGELRLSENGHTLAALNRTGQRNLVRSNAYGGEDNFSLVCDLDIFRLERIEQLRGGKPPVFWVELWPTLLSKVGHIDATIRPFRISIPREAWLGFLEKVRNDRYEILELRFARNDAEAMGKTLEYLRLAEARLYDGDYPNAVATCRKALEALAIANELPATGGDWRSALGILTQERIAKEYASILSSIKQLAGFEIHELGKPDPQYTRAEAQFIIRSTENLTALIGHLRHRAKQE